MGWGFFCLPEQQVEGGTGKTRHPGQTMVMGFLRLAPLQGGGAPEKPLTTRCHGTLALASTLRF
jgi:hypothetical protein